MCRQHEAKRRIEFQQKHHLGFMKCVEEFSVKGRLRLMIASRFRPNSAPNLLLVFLLLTVPFMAPAVAQAQFTFTTNADNTLTITGYLPPSLHCLGEFYQPLFFVIPVCLELTTFIRLSKEYISRFGRNTY
jgi:hypothetical protein